MCCILFYFCLNQLKTWLNENNVVTAAQFRSKSNCETSDVNYDPPSSITHRLYFPNKINAAVILLFSKKYLTVDRS